MEENSRERNSATPESGLSSAHSTDRVNAGKPPAIKPWTNVGGTPNVGGHSEASRTPNLPDVPAPM
jgi:hypothetical protein